MMLAAPGFWWRPPRVRATLLRPLGWAYGRISSTRMTRPAPTAAIPVICVGNFVVGGAGKTPAAMALRHHLEEAGYRPAVLTRGYGGSVKGIVQVDATSTHREVGDEALLLAREGPTFVGPDRRAGVEAIQAAGHDCVIMDDGFQNPGIAKHLNLVVVDARRGLGNGYVMPAGPLRAPLDAQFALADAAVVVGQGDAGRAFVRHAARRNLPVLTASLRPVRNEDFKGKRYVAFAGIGDPERFFVTLEQEGAIVGSRMPFPDHHVFSDRDARWIMRIAQEDGLIPITTEKDAVRMGGEGGALADLRHRMELFPVRLSFDEPAKLAVLIRRAIDGP